MNVQQVYFSPPMGGCWFDFGSTRVAFQLLTGANPVLTKAAFLDTNGSADAVTCGDNTKPDVAALGALQPWTWSRIGKN